MEIKPTCINCEHYCATIQSAAGGNWHKHDFCILWDTTIPAFTSDDWDDETEVVHWDDIETGLAHCHGFIPRQDGLYTERFKTNG